MADIDSLHADESWATIKVWRRRMREELIARRMGVPAEQRRAWNSAISVCIETGFPLLAGMTIGFCWPFKGEFDARFVLRTFRARGSTAALPEVIATLAPLQFRKWWPGAPMKPGVYGIPVPTGTEIMVPDAAFVPMNGFDEHGYRLGYGGGYFDLTLAAAAPRPIAIGVGFEHARLKTIYPQPHDIAMDFIVTEAGIHAVIASRLVSIDSAECLARAQQLCDERKLPASEGGGFSSPPCYASEFPEYFGGTKDD
jgi:5-formyltetrahydrofolate cyclo-ligase